MNNAFLVIGVLVLIAALFFLYTAFAKKYLYKEDAEDKPKNKDLVNLSKRGSIIFYIFLLLILIFFLVMYIMWKTQ
ncbi:MAG: hypothetical protein WC135_04035 [Bacteroidales bacterium]